MKNVIFFLFSHSRSLPYIIKKKYKQYRILHGKWVRTVFTHELLTYQRTSEISDTKTTSFWDVFHFSTRETLLYGLSSLNVVSEATRKARALQAASAYKKRGFWRKTHTPLWLLIERIIFLTREKHRSPLWLARTHLRMKIYVIASHWVYLRMYKIKNFNQGNKMNHSNVKEISPQNQTKLLLRFWMNIIHYWMRLNIILRIKTHSSIYIILQMIGWVWSSEVNVVLNRTVVVDTDWSFDNLWGSHLESQSELYHVSWWYLTLVVDLIGQLSRDVIGRLSVKPWCPWLWRLVVSLVSFDPSIITVNQSFIVSQIVSCPVLLSCLVLVDSVNKSFVRCP